VLAAAAVAGWLLFLGWRRSYAPGLRWGAALFNLRQLLIVGWTLAALVLLAVAIHQGLLGSPDMQVEGNGSTDGVLRWFEDRSGPVLPQGWMISVPLLVYRAVMLAWALWLALSLLRWLRWGWEAFGTGGLWRASPRRAPAVVEATPATGAPPPGGT
jgi:hypothetical protein